ncbi:sugar phosphate nucleotidyltransferase [uncultured Prevotella sp.]|uniref:sugar phosphate nucleotidyltransferase n=1 Tax=uncultured Prevotella sp. TaxID=159272 RepID=UPI00266BB1A6|nr:sugar phosphate nucleotidyltransferase [uncultured Prevotella sp.]
MQLVLLSGGSGKRLWPLSNDARSKQFLPLLASPDGGMESMIQRVVRQIREAQLTDNITLATNAVQRDSIINQLGENVNVVTEPERRDTFPAIALATSYLAKEQKCNDDEVVVIMPCDVYTESKYFATIAKMVEAVENNVADLVLMGITPTYPSEKFGYVVPESTLSSESAFNNECLRVARFTEKPNEEKVKELLKQNAFWNGGVFAFRLGYMMNIVNQYIQTDTFPETHKRYTEFPKISFDYEVAEKAESVAVVPFSGEWKDLGTWNALCEELPSTHIGNVMMGDHNENTHAVNELGIPVFCNGLKDVIVAASPDGIMVCDKQDSEKIKDYANKLTTRPMYEERRWGTYRVLDNAEYEDGTRSLTKTIHLNAGKNISYQLHHHRSEVWTCVEGEGIFVLDGERKNVKRGDVMNIPVEHLHAIKATTDLTFIEVQIGNPLVEEDIERFELDWNIIV